MDSDIRDKATGFEAIKVGMTQDRRGHILKLAIHPDDTPADLMRDTVGQRYQVALVRISDEGQPIAPKEESEGYKAIKLAAALCHNEEFQQWLIDHHGADGLSFVGADHALKQLISIRSKTEFRDNKAARVRLRGIAEEFRVAQKWKRNG